MKHCSGITLWENKQMKMNKLSLLLCCLTISVPFFGEVYTILMNNIYSNL